MGRFFGGDRNVLDFTLDVSKQIIGLWLLTLLGSNLKLSQVLAEARNIWNLRKFFDTKFIEIMKLEFHLIQTTKKNWNKNERMSGSLCFGFTPFFPPNSNDFLEKTMGVKPLKPRDPDIPTFFLARPRWELDSNMCCCEVAVCWSLSRFCRTRWEKMNGWDMEM